MIRHILFWKYTDTVKAEHKEAEALAFLQKSVATMVGHIDGLRCAEINTNTAGGEYDLVFYLSCGMRMPYKHSKIIRCILPTGSAARPL